MKIVKQTKKKDFSGPYSLAVSFQAYKGVWELAEECNTTAKDIASQLLEEALKNVEVVENE